jgi:hypothetical protein
MLLSQRALQPDSARKGLGDGSSKAGGILACVDATPGSGPLYRLGNNSDFFAICGAARNYQKFSGGLEGLFGPFSGKLLSLRRSARLAEEILWAKENENHDKTDSLYGRTAKTCEEISCRCTKQAGVFQRVEDRSR